MLVTYGPPYPETGDAFEATAPAPAGYPLVRAVAATPDAAALAFAALWEDQPGRDPEDALEFVRAVRVRAEEALVLGDGWRVRANPGDGTEISATADSREQVEADFVAAWNAARGTDFAPEDFAFDRVG